LAAPGIHSEGLARSKILFGSGWPSINENRLPADIRKRSIMIWLTRLNRVPVVLNSDMIEHIEVTPDTVITLTNGQICRVRESAEEVVARIVEFRRRISGPEPVLSKLSADSGESGPSTLFSRVSR
jgi:flagellar protein FlbD